ncbi:MAG: sigma-70 family RNA polymerase sigma factor [Acidobacteriales bacterium]|nr:sigma-70 family RNA polymerase sigma factor [Terriglobales bacterium]
MAAGSSETTRVSPALLQELYARSGAADLGLGREAFAEVLASVIAKAAPADRDGFLRGLRIEDLALARACAAGSEKAWEVFLTRFREKLHDAARGITREDSSARELADSLYADLYGTKEREGRRVSKLEHYNGRGSLDGWLRTVMAQEWVNRYRKTKKFTSLEEEEESGAQFSAAVTNHQAAPEQVVIAAVDGALAALSVEDRYILAAYFLDERTLAEVGRTLKVHESTISRRVEKIAVAVRKGILEQLVRSGMSRRQSEEAMELDVRDLAVDVRARLSHQAPGSLSRSNVQDSDGEAFTEEKGE